MTLALPRDIMNKVDQRWNARAAQAETSPLAADRLKQHEQVSEETDQTVALASEAAPTPAPVKQ
jgi:hypothetical protein